MESVNHFKPLQVSLKELIVGRISDLKFGQYFTVFKVLEVLSSKKSFSLGHCRLFRLSSSFEVAKTRYFDLDGESIVHTFQIHIGHLANVTRVAVSTEDVEQMLGSSGWLNEASELHGRGVSLLQI